MSVLTRGGPSGTPHNLVPLLVGTSIVGVSAGFGAAWGYQDGYNDAYIDSLTLTPMVGEHQGLILSGRF